MAGPQTPDALALVELLAALWLLHRQNRGTAPAASPRAGDLAALGQPAE